MTLKLIGFLAIAAGPALSQTVSETRPRFAVVSIKPNRSGCCPVFGVGNGAGGGKYVTLKMLIALAYRVQQFQISGGPTWIDSDRFDIEGKVEDPKADFDQLRLMLRSVFEDRFSLKLHHETKRTSVYALVPVNGGPNLELSADQSSPDINGPAPKGAGPNHGAIRMGAGTIAGNAVTLSLFARMLSQRLDRPVVDRTNLTGRFNILLQWAPSETENRFDPGGSEFQESIIDTTGRSVSVDHSGPSIFSAIQQQMGLRLQSAKAAVEFLVIDHVDKPSQN